MSFALPPLIWFLFLSWSPGLLIENEDGLAVIYLQARNLYEQHGDWTKVLYRLSIEGGAKIHETLGTVPLTALLSWSGVPPAIALNLLLFAIQGAFAFLVLKSARDLATLFYKNQETAKNEARLTERVAIVTLSAFAPLVAWRLPYGHENLFLGSLVYLVVLSLALSVAARSLSVIQTLLSVAVLVQAIRDSGQQAILYSVVFGGIILLGGALNAEGGFRRGFLHGLRARRTPALIALLAGVAATLIALPGYWGMLTNALWSTDSARSNLGALLPVTYSYYTSSWLDWVQSFAWTIYSIPTWIPTYLHHEVNYPLGPLLLVALAFPWSRAKKIALGLVLCAFLVFCFSTDTFPVSTALLTLIPPLGMFRVPSRAIVPVLYTVIVIASSVMLANSDSGTPSRKNSWIRFLAVAAAVALARFPQSSRLTGVLSEILAWDLAGLIFLSARKSDPHWRLSREVAMLLLAGLSIQAFRQRINPMVDVADFETRISQMRASMLAQAPDLASPLNRVVLDFGLPHLANNSAYALGLSTIDGYLQANRRFHDLVDAARGERDLTGTMMNYHFGDTPTFRLLAPLYNVRYRAVIETSGARQTPVVLQPTHLGRGSAWFSDTLAPTASYGSLVENLRFWNGRDAWYIANDAAIDTDLARRLSRIDAKKCAQARVLDSIALADGQGARIEVSTTEPCVLSVAMNFVSTLEAVGAPGTLDVFPVYGALTGVLVPPGHQWIEVQDRPRLPAWTVWSQRLGYLILFFICLNSAWISFRGPRPVAAVAP